MKFQSILGGMIMFMGGQSRADYASLEEFKAEFRGKAAKHGYIFDEFCAEACYYTPRCRLDPQSQGSYCKKNNHPSVCFGLYIVPPHHHHGGLRGEELELEGGREEGLMKTPDLEGSRFFHRRRLCYEPNDRYCPEQFPLRCGWRRDSHEMGDERDGGLMDGKL